MEEHAGPIVKGKRTKRLRLQSPTPFEASSPTTATSSAELFSSTTEEEEDMANCLILLAQGNNECRKPVDKPPSMPPPATAFEDHNHCRYNEAAAAPKFTSRRYLEAATGSQAGYYVYQCKTCDRTFPSFQALGGHRASHKKPKNTPNSHHHNSGGSFIDPLSSPSRSSLEKKQIFTILPSSSDDEEGQFRRYSSLSLQLGSNHNIKPPPSIFNHSNHNNLKNLNNGGSKVHECSICGAEFMSGQALGGHMRRHRTAPVGGSGPITALSLTPLRTFKGSEGPSPTSLALHHGQSMANNLSLDLDLNLPASAQDHHHVAGHQDRADHQESHDLIRFSSLLDKSPLQQQQQQQQQEEVEQKSQSGNNKSSLVFSASPALVDCHY
ncbi:hypothetical protein SAY86_005693 [Trapa natans]|uniref:C2H2-type domain-containing protein n=1 Tax=Trapa natans TaxID=22666 RepID=A0AAN7QV16_TRANT|nr:hypothetical protein SAY86_005693 [Trapa natans]